MNLERNRLAVLDGQTSHCLMDGSGIFGREYRLVLLLCVSRGLQGSSFLRVQSCAETARLRATR